MWNYARGGGGGFTGWNGEGWWRMKQKRGDNKVSPVVLNRSFVLIITLVALLNAGGINTSEYAKREQNFLKNSE